MSLPPPFRSVLLTVGDRMTPWGRGATESVAAVLGAPVASHLPHPLQPFPSLLGGEQVTRLVHVLHHKLADAALDAVYPFPTLAYCVFTGFLLCHECQQSVALLVQLLPLFRDFLFEPVEILLEGAFLLVGKAYFPPEVTAGRALGISAVFAGDHVVQPDADESDVEGQ
jgi:hypothetical protein